MQITLTLDNLIHSDNHSAYENDTIISREKLFKCKYCGSYESSKCKHCSSYESFKWFKVTGESDKDEAISEVVDKNDADTITAFSFWCAKLWRKYVVYWED